MPGLCVFLVHEFGRAPGCSGPGVRTPLFREQLTFSAATVRTMVHMCICQVAIEEQTTLRQRQMVDKMYVPSVGASS